MNKIVYYLIGIVSLLFVIFLFLHFSGLLRGEFNIAEEERVFFILCREWNNKGCTIDSLNNIDDVQEFWGDVTLTESCKRKFPQEDEQRSIIICEDVCNNDCYSELFYDVAVFNNSVIRDPDANQIIVYVNNTGSASVFNLNISIFNASTNILKSSYKRDIRAKEFVELRCNINTCGQDILVKVDPNNEINETNEDNNRVSKKWFD
ncbi:MAG: CARDB domain-containing protein [Candidatus Aenigmatarchaeota archaeon]